uniref:Uncharacterized protein n=1 Tax=Arundo donax TaxID=35708 RepID=A0A0A9C1D5_ARUDO
MHGFVWPTHIQTLPRIGTTELVQFLNHFEIELIAPQFKQIPECYPECAYTIAMEHKQEAKTSKTNH